MNLADALKSCPPGPANTRLAVARVGDVEYFCIEYSGGYKEFFREVGEFDDDKTFRCVAAVPADADWRPGNGER